MNHVHTLAETAIGERVVITALHASPQECHRLIALGFVVGSTVQAVQASPWGDPVAYDVCGAVIALRQSDAQQICVSG